jgi:SSS family solute:Na+ symporter
MWALAAIGAFALAYQIWGGLKAVALTDIVQVALLVTGGLIIAWLSLGKIGGGDVLAGFHQLTTQFPDKFDMILSKDNPHYKDLPGIAVLVGGLWIMNISYWGFNQYIIQRALGAKDLKEAQKGIAMAAYLKLLMPVIVVLPGIAALVLAPQGIKPDQAYPEMMKLLPPGLLGLVFAALVAAIVASLAAKINSIATIFTLDLYAKARGIKTRGEDNVAGVEGQEKHLVLVGRVVAAIAVVIAIIAAKPLIGQSDQAFQFIQEFSGFFTPGITVIFLLGLFWKPATEAGAIVAALTSVLLSTLLKYSVPAPWLPDALNAYLLPFMNRMMFVFVVSLFLAMVVSLVVRGRGDANRVTMEGVTFRTTGAFNIAGIGVILILIALYATWW